MDRRSRSIESPRRHRGRREHRRGHSRSRSISRNRSRGIERRRRTRTRSRSRERHRRSPDRDLYKDIINQDYQEERHLIERERYQEEREFRIRQQEEREFRSRHLDERDFVWHERPYDRERGRDFDRDREKDRREHRNRERERERERDRDRDRERDVDRHKRFQSPEKDDLSDGYDTDMAIQEHCMSNNLTPNNTIIVLGLAQHITEADICADLIQYGLKPVSIRMIRKKKTGASRGFAFVEFITEEEATSWMEIKQGTLMLQDQYRGIMQYSHCKERTTKDKTPTDWYCAKCGVFNFKRRENCFKCYASREESEKGGEGSDEISNILTKKIMLRNLDVLTNEEGVLTIMQEVAPAQVSNISKILICRDPLTQTSRGICYLHFDNLVDSMNTHNALKALEPPLTIDSREVLVSYCVDSENKQIAKTSTSKNNAESAPAVSYTANTYQYTFADVPRLAEYSASLYASTPTEHDHYLKYYTQYYMAEISKGEFGSLPTTTQLGGSANSAAAVALSAIQRKQKLKVAEVTTSYLHQPEIVVPAIVPLNTPKGNDGKKYPTPDVSLYQYDDTSGYYYDPVTGLYYDAHSQYYYNNETGAYLYWDQDKSTYTLATTAGFPTASISATATTTTTTPTATTTADIVAVAKPAEEQKKDPSKKDPKQDKVKVAKKIVKDMEKWAKQLNQKKEFGNYVATPQPILTSKNEETVPRSSVGSSSGYADVGFSILEKKERGKLADLVVPGINKLVPSYTSDSDDLDDNNSSSQFTHETNEKDYVDFEKLTCLLCKRAFQSQDILNKHLKMSNLHKENLQKYNLSHGLIESGGPGSSQSYRDRAKERRLKYGESDPPMPNRTKERFEKEMKNVSSSAQPQLGTIPIGENNVGNRLLKKMGWTEGQGLGRTNQGRTNIIEPDARNSTAGLGTKTCAFGPGDDYKSYIKRMMKSRYEQVDIK